MEMWYVKSSGEKVFGPIDFETLKNWVKDGRVEPTAGISTDLKNWMMAPLKPELEMNWVVENNPGQFYGPTHRSVLEDLKKSGVLLKDARYYVDDRGQALERQRALETALKAKDAELVQRETSLAAAQQLAAKKDLQIASVQKALAQRDERIAASVTALAQKDSQIVELMKQAQMREGELARVRQDQEATTAKMKAVLEELARKDAELADVKEQLAKKDAVRPREWTAEVMVPEVVSEIPPPTARQAFGFGGGVATTSLADLERRAQQELARMGAAGQNFFRRK